MKSKVCLLLGLLLVPLLSMAQYVPGQHCLTPEKAVTQAGSARAQAVDRGFLWKIEKDGRSSYLYGTVHVGKPEWLQLGPKTRQALSESKLLALEVDTNSPQVQQEMARALAQDKSRFPADILGVLQGSLAALCLDSGIFLQLPATLQMTLVAAALSRHEGLFENFGIDNLLARQARVMGKTVVSLEKASDQIALLRELFSSETTIANMRSKIAAISGDAMNAEWMKIRNSIRGLAQSWETGDIAKLGNYTSWCDCVDTEHDQQMLVKMNDDRNPTIADGVDRLHHGQSVFAAVGALHFSGPKAIQLLMQQKGYRVTRITN